MRSGGVVRRFHTTRVTHFGFEAPVVGSGKGEEVGGDGWVCFETGLV